jgi:methyl-accepting chemotaxis protein
MLRNPTLRAKILALPCVAALGFLVTLGVTVSLNRTSKAELALIQHGYAPALDASRRLETRLDGYQRALRDAIGASDTGAVAKADTLVRGFHAISYALRTNPTVDSMSIVALEGAFDSYARTARATSMGMITGTMGDMMGGMSSMKADFAKVSALLASRTAANEAAIKTAFTRANAVRDTAQWVTSSVLVVSLLVLGVLAIGTLRNIVGAMKALSTAATEIAKGRLEQDIVVVTNDEIGELGTAFRSMVDYVGTIANAANRLAAGDLSTVVTPRSEHDVLSRNMNRACETLQNIIGEAGLLIEAARQGELGKRGNPDRFQGAYGELIAGTNAMLDAVVRPISEAQDVLARVADRDLTARVEGVYLGDHAAIKESLNTALDHIAEVFASLTMAISQVNAAASEIGSGSQDLATGARDRE